MTRDVDLLKTVGDVLFTRFSNISYDKTKPYTCLLYPEDLFNMTRPDVFTFLQGLLDSHMTELTAAFGPFKHINWYANAPADGVQSVHPISV